ncbi:MAG: hypothetical protein QM723_25850 [Myxococcaceae bacterium]
MRTAIFGFALLLCSSCAALLGSPVVPEAKGDYNPTGEIALADRGATFDAVRVRNPKVSFTKKVDGSWGGTIVDPGNITQAMDLTVTPKKISGVDIVLTLESQDDQNTVIVGQYQGRILRFEFHPDVVEIRTSGNSWTFHKHDENTWGPKGELLLKGDAGKAPQPWPQIALAMLAAFD